jgi:hypothetical protein
VQLLQPRLQRKKVRFGEAKVMSHVQWQAEMMALDGGGSESIQRDHAQRCAVQNVQRLIAIDGLEQVSVVLKEVMSVEVDLEQQWRLALTPGRRGQRRQQRCPVAWRQLALFSYEKVLIFRTARRRLKEFHLTILKFVSSSCARTGRSFLGLSRRRVYTVDLKVADLLPFSPRCARTRPKSQNRAPSASLK